MWFLSKIKYQIQQEAGKWKTIREQFLQEGITYGEIEKQLAELLEGRVTDYEYDIVKASFNAVYDTFVGGNFYKVMIEESDVDAKGQPKINSYTHLVAADSVPDAERRATEYTKNWTCSTTIVGADKTKIVGVWHPKIQEWQDDFNQRIADLVEEGHKSADANQTTLFDTDGQAKARSIFHGMVSDMATEGISVSVKGPGEKEYTHLK